MKKFAAIAYPSLSLLCLFPALSSAIRGTDADLLQQFIHMPRCAINCTVPVLVQIDCLSADISKTAPCICGNIEAERTIANCVLAACSYEDLVKVEALQYDMCYDEPRPSRTGVILGATIVMTILTILMVAARCYSRIVISKQFWWDDWFLLGSLTMFLGIAAVNFWGISMGFGVHVWNVNPDDNVSLYQYEWIYQMFYAASISFTRTSVALLIYRIFPQRWMQRLVWCAISSYWIVLFAYLFLIIFQCNPVALVYDKTREGTCINFHNIILSAAIVTIAESVGLILLPIPSILKLQLDWRKKLEIISIMSIGLIAVLCSLVRLKYVIVFGYSIDINWNDIPISVISIVEIAVSIWCVCFPAIKLLMARTWPKSIFRRRSVNRGLQTSIAVNVSNAAQPAPKSTGRFHEMRYKFASMFGIPQQGLGSTTKTSTTSDWSTKSELASLPHVNEDGIASPMNKSVDRVWNLKV